MEFDDDAFVLAARAHGEAGAIVELLTQMHGKWAAHVAGGASRRLRPLMQPGARVRLRYRARTAEQLGSASLESEGEGPSALFDDPLALAGLASAAAVLSAALPEREPYPGAFLAFEALLEALGLPEIWPAVLVRFEAGLLEILGFGLDLGRCAVTGSTDDLAWVSPRTGRAVSAQAGEPWKDRLLPLPRFLISAQEPVGPGDVGAGLAITGRFLEQFVFGVVSRPLPAARVRLTEVLADAGRL
ncbi:MAG TPA: DNA repair protein RecO [Caulobacteraceae bacterium]|nr:DNA repair protein RecO [Caulobacteraceae bacterium]